MIPYGVRGLLIRSVCQHTLDRVAKTYVVSNHCLRDEGRHEAVVLTNFVLCQVVDVDVDFQQVLKCNQHVECYKAE